ncbi:MAG TPA: SDR family oxidoreductase [Rhodopila sp.]|nr:SDR family oxidoreductase [Rhodopila sp.]
MRNNPRTVLITGAAKRIGAAVARKLAADGWNVIIHYNQSATEAKTLADEIGQTGGVCSLVRADLACRSELEGLIEKCRSFYGSIQCLINNASLFYYDDITSVTWETLQDHLSMNLVAPTFLSRDFARLFPDQSDACIINILDQKVANLNPDFLSYTLSKVGLAGLTNVLAMALAGRVRVCAIAPGLALISGKQTQESFERAWQATPLRRSTTPDEIANCVQFILATPSMTGNTIFLDGGESLAGRARDVAFDSSV